MAKINRKIADALGMDVPEEEEVVESLPVTVEPAELPIPENPELPDMVDIDRRTLEAEAELQSVIDMTMDQARCLQDGMEEIDPRFKNRYVENTNGTLQVALDAIKTKADIQMKKRENRLKEANFKLESRNQKGGQANSTTNNIFVGSREDLMKLFHKPEEDDTA